MCSLFEKDGGRIGAFNVVLAAHTTGHLGQLETGCVEPVVSKELSC